MTNLPAKPAKRESSATLLQRYTRESDNSAFEELARRHAKTVWGVCIRVLRNHTDAEDAFQNTFLLLAQKANRIRKPGSLSSWLHGVAWKTATRIRKRRLPIYPENTDPVVEGCEPYEVLARQHQVEQVDQQLLQLSEKYRTPLILFYFEDQTATQIAVELNLTTAAVEGRLRRGRQQLKVGLLRNGYCFSIVLPLMCAARLPVQVAGNVGPGLCVPSSNHSQTGASIMLKKILLSTSAVALLAVSGALHARSSAKSTSTTAEILDTKTGEDAASVAAVIRVDQNETKTPQEALHDHIVDVHNRIYNFFRSLHG
ncbi:MAG: RNA polymerase sigma factor [Planctomycetaceae bacterium]